MKTAYSYIRFSSLEQSKGDSFRRQIEGAKKWCKENSYVLAEQNFFDKGKSAFKGDNLKEGGELNKFVELVKEGKIPLNSVLIIDSVDRFSRLPTSKSASIFLNVINAGVSLVFAGSYDKRIVDENLINKEPYILQAIIAELNRAHRESAEKSRKIIEAKQAKKAQMQGGEIVAHNNVPKYFTYVPITKTHGKYIHNKNTELVLEMVKDILAGKSLYEISAQLNKRGIPTIRRKLQWSPSSIRQILKNPALFGTYLGNKDYLPSIIDETTFQKVQNVLNNNVTNRGRKANLVNIFRGICYCAECGRAMNVISSNLKGVDYRYLRCSNYGKKTTCEKAYLSLDRVESDFFFEFLCKDPYKLINGDDVAEVKAITKEIAAKTARQNEVKREIEKAIAVMRELPMEELKNKLSKLSGERVTLKTEIDALNAKAATIQDLPKDLEKWAMRTTRFGEGENGEDIVKTMFVGTPEKIRKALADNEAREKLRVMLPNMIGKVTVDSKKRAFTVFNRVGRKIFQSDPISSNNNNSARWRESLKTYTTRKGKTIKRKTQEPTEPIETTERTAKQRVAKYLASVS